MGVGFASPRFARLLLVGVALRFMAGTMALGFVTAGTMSAGMVTTAVMSTTVAAAGHGCCRK